MKRRPVREAVVVASFLALAAAIFLDRGNDLRVLALQSMLCGTLSITIIVSLRRLTDNAVLAGAILASLAALAFVIAAPLFGIDGGFDRFLVYESAIAAGATAAAFAIRRLPELTDR